MNTTSHLKELISKIQSKEGYKGHIVLDAGQVNVLVLAKGELYNYAKSHNGKPTGQHQWYKLALEEAETVAERAYHSNSFKELMRLKTP